MVDALLGIGIPKDKIITIEVGKVYKIGDIQFSPITLYHDVENFGYRLFKDGLKVIHATDTRHLQGITAKGYDIAVIETNHELEAAKAIIKQKAIDGEFCHLERAIKTHLSVSATIDFMNENGIKKLYPVHIGGSTIKAVFEKLSEVDFEVKREYKV